MSFSLRLLGGAVLEGADGAVSGRAAHKRRIALLAILAAARRKPVPRERIIGLLWPESQSSAARHLLSESLSVLRKELGEGVFVARGDDLLLNGEVVRSDIEIFEDGVDRCDAAAAAAAYEGPFLDGFYVADAPDFERWAELERERLARAYARVLETLADEREREGEWLAAVEWWRRLAVADPLSSRVALRLITALAASGEREGALRHAATHAAMLREELGTEPSAEVSALVERLRSDPGESPTQAPAAVAAPALAATSDSAPGLAAVEHEASSEMERPRTAPTQPPSAPPEPVARRNAVVWFADVPGYAALAVRDRRGARMVRDTLHAAARREVRGAGGHIVELSDDSVFAEFSDAVAGARACLRLLRAVERRTHQGGVPVTLRVGVHVGAVAVSDDGGVYGDPVSVASRLQARAEAGQVLVSDEIRERLRHHPGFRFAGRGVVSVAGVSARVHAFDLQTHRQARASRAPGLVPQMRRAAHVPAPGWRRSAISAVLVLALGLFIFAMWRTSRPAPGTGALDPNRVAILYFSASTQDEEMRALSRGLTHALISQLSQVDALSVVPPSGVARFRDGTLPPDSVARALGSGTLLEGSLARAGDRLRLTLFLVDAASGERLRSTVLEARVGDPFALEEKLSFEAARFLRWRLGRALEVRTRSSGARDPEARALVLHAEQLREDALALVRARDPLQKGAGLRALARADTLLMRAEAADPRWAEPVVQRGWVAVERGAHSDVQAERMLLRAALGYAERALRLRRGDARALELRGNVYWTLSRFHQEPDSADALVSAAAADLRSAVDADPGRASAWSTLSQLLRLLGDHEGAYFAADRAARADAYLLSADQVRHRLFRSALSAGRFDLAREHCAAGRREFPADWRFAECPLVLLAYDDTRPALPAEAEAALAKIRTVDPEPSARADGRPYLPVYRRMLYAAVLARAGQHDSAQAVVTRARDEVSALPEMQASFAFDLAHVSLCLGDHAGAVTALRELFRLQPQMKRSVGREHVFRPLSTDSGFREAVRGG